MYQQVLFYLMNTVYLIHSQKRKEDRQILRKYVQRNIQSDSRVVK